MKKNIDSLIHWLSDYELKDGQAIVILIVSVVIFFSPLLFFGKILLYGDAVYYDYPVAYFFSHFLGSGINPFVFSGSPVTSDFTFGYFHPVYNLLFGIFNYIFAYHLLLFLDFSGALFFTYLFIRKIGLSVYSAILGSVAYTFSQFSMAWIGALSVANAVVLLPVLMYSMLQIATLRKRYVIVFGVILGFAFLATHYQFIIMALLGTGVYFLFETWLRWNKEVKTVTNFKPLFYLCIGVLLALTISLPQSLNSLNFFSGSTRAVVLVYIGAKYMDLVRYLIPTWTLPYISKVEFRPYIGIAPLFFGLVGFYQIFRKKITEKRSLFFAWFFVVTFIMCLEYSPSVLILKHLPFLKYFIEQSRWMYLANFALVILATYGFDFVLNSKEIFPGVALSKFIRRVVIGVVGFFVTANIILLFFGKKIVLYLQNYFDSNLYAHTTHLPLQYYHDIINIMARDLFKNFSFLNINIIILIVSITFLHGLLKLSNKKLLFSNLMVLFVIVNMLAVSFVSLKLADKSLFSGKSHIADFISAHESSPYDYRVFDFLVLFGQYQEITATHPEAEEASLIYAKEALLGNLNIFSETPIVGGIGPVIFRRYEDMVVFLENTTAEKNTDKKVSLFLSELPLLSALNVKYIVSPYVLESPDLTLVFSEKITSFNVPLYLYQNKRVLSRVYIARNVSFLPENKEDQSFSQVTDSKEDFKNLTFIECDKCKPSQEPIDDQATVSISYEDSIKLDMVVTSSTDEWLVVANEAVPGWDASVDGNSVPIYYANHAFQSVFVSKGKHRVLFYYNIIPELIKK